MVTVFQRTSVVLKLNAFYSLKNRSPTYFKAGDEGNS